MVAHDEIEGIQVSTKLREATLDKEDDSLLWPTRE
jgi:hypothetical protein